MDLSDVAIQVPATRRSMWRRVLIVDALVLATAVLGVLGIVQLRATLAADALQRDGARSTATVLSVHSQRVGPRGQYVDGTVTIRYEAAGAVHEAVVDVGADVDRQREGTTVAVVVDPDDAERVALVDQTPQVAGVPAVVALGLSLLAGAMAVVAGRTVHRLRRVLHEEPWLYVRSRLCQTALHEGSRRGSRTFVLLETPRGEVSVEPIGLNRVDPTFAPEAWVAGLDGASMALARPGGGHVVAVRRRTPPPLALDADQPEAPRRRPPR